MPSIYSVPSKTPVQAAAHKPGEPGAGPPPSQQSALGPASKPGEPIPGT